MTDPWPSSMRAGPADCPLLVRRWGAGERAVVCWHALGTTRSGEAFADVAPILARELGASVFAVDAPGFGGSQPPPTADGYRPSALAARAVATLDDLGLADVLWLGQSWGATIGCHVAARFGGRLSALVLLDAGYQDVAPPDGGLAALVTDVRAEWEALPPDAPPPTVTPDVLAAATWGVACEPPSATWAAIAAAAVPVLLLAAEHPAGENRAERIAAFAAAIPQAGVLMLPGTGHDVLGEDPAAVVRAVTGRRPGDGARNPI